MQSSVYVCIFYRDGKVVAHATGPKAEFEFPNLDAPADEPHAQVTELHLHSAKALTISRRL
jgi:hypothetical protein